MRFINWKLLFVKYMFWLILGIHFITALFISKETYGVNYTVGWQWSIDTLILILYWCIASYAWIVYSLGYGFIALIGYRTHWKLSILHFLSFILSSLSHMLFIAHYSELFLLLELLIIGLFVMNLMYAIKTKKRLTSKGKYM